MATRPLPAAVLFDLDGLLLDSERVALDTFLRACAEHGVHGPDIAVYRRCIGQTDDGTRLALADGYGPTFPLEEVLNRWDSLYVEHVDNRPVPVMRGAVELLDALAGASVRLAVVTSSQTVRAERKLELSGLRGRFEAVTGGDQVRSGKPAPDLYLRGLERAGLRAADCWAVEDSANGVRAALAAGLRVVQVPDLVPLTPEMRALGHPVVDSLAEVHRTLTL